MLSTNIFHDNFGSQAEIHSTKEIIEDKKEARVIQNQEMEDAEPKAKNEGETLEGTQVTEVAPWRQQPPSYLRG